MGTRKSGDDSPSAKVLEQRPGSYAQVVSPRRKRADDGERPSSDLAARPAILREGFLDELPTSRVTVPDGAPSGPVDDLRPSRAGASPRGRREVGPLGMDDARAPAEPEAPAPRPRAANNVIKQRVQVVEINPPELSSPSDPSSVRGELTSNVANDVQPVSTGPRTASAPPRGVLRPSEPPRGSARPSQRPDPFAGVAAFDGAHLHARPASIRPSVAPGAASPEPQSDVLPEDPFGDFTDQEVTSLVESSSLSSSDEAPTVERKSLSLFEADAALYAERRQEMSRPSLSSVLDARPSLLPSPPPARDNSALAWRIVIGGLCMVIVAALWVALREPSGAPGKPLEARDVPTAEVAPSAPTDTEGQPAKARETPTASPERADSEAREPVEAAPTLAPAAPKAAGGTGSPALGRAPTTAPSRAGSSAAHATAASPTAPARGATAVPAREQATTRAPDDADRALPPNPYLD